MAYESTFKISSQLIVSIKINGLLKIPIYSAFISALNFWLNCYFPKLTKNGAIPFDVSIKDAR